MINNKVENDLGMCVLLMLLNNKMYESGMISESMKNKITSEINMDYQRNRTA